MPYIIINRDDERVDGLRSNMRNSMRRINMRHHEGAEGGDFEQAYKLGYRHGYEDHERDMRGDDMPMQMRRSRDSRGRFA